MSETNQNMLFQKRRKPKYILDELIRLQERQNWNKLFKTKIQPEVNPSPKGSMLLSIPNDVVAKKRRPYSSPAMRRSPVKNKSSSPTTHSKRASLSFSTTTESPHKSTVDVNCNLETALRRYDCSPEQFEFSFKKDRTILPKDATEIYKEFSTSNPSNISLSSSPFKLTEGERNTIEINKSSLKSYKKDMKPVGMMLVVDPCLQTDSHLINLKFLYDDESDEMNENEYEIENKPNNVIFTMISGTGYPFHLRPTISETDDDDDDDGNETRIIPGWQGHLPIWIPSLSCVCEMSRIGHSSVTLDDDGNSAGNTGHQRVCLDERSVCSLASDKAMTQFFVNSASGAASNRASTATTTSGSGSSRSKRTVQPSIDVSLIAFPARSQEEGMRLLHRSIDEILRRRTANLQLLGGLPVLNLAVLQGNLHAVAELVRAGADVNQRSQQTLSTALHEAVFAGCFDVASFLLNKGALTAIRDGDGSTALHLSCHKNDLVMTKALVRGVDVRKALLVKDNKGRTPLDLAQGLLSTYLREVMVKLGLVAKVPRKSLLP